MEPNGVLPVEGDARNEDVLRDAAIGDAAAVVAAIDDSNANIQIAITASQIAPDVRLVVRVGDEDYTSVARRAGADEVVIPEVLSGEDVSDAL
jgi:voltage-gated potassium channel